MVELADVLDRPLQLLIIVEPAADLGDPLATHAELLRAPASVSHGQHEDLMPFAARAFRAALVCRTVRSNNDPRSNSPLTGSLPMSLLRA
jgi:hypothetical protein